MLTPEQHEEIRKAWALSGDVLGVELLKEHAPDEFKRIADPIILTPEVRTSGRPGPTTIQLVMKAAGAYLIETWETVTEPYAVELRKLVCKELKYCESRLNDDGIVMATMIADSIASWYMTAHSLPVTSMTVFALKKGLFDHLCNCPPKK